MMTSQWTTIKSHVKLERRQRLRICPADIQKTLRVLETPQALYVFLECFPFTAFQLVVSVLVSRWKCKRTKDVSCLIMLPKRIIQCKVGHISKFCQEKETWFCNSQCCIWLRRLYSTTTVKSAPQADRTDVTQSPDLSICHSRFRHSIESLLNFILFAWEAQI